MSVDIGTRVKEVNLPIPQQKTYDDIIFPLILTPSSDDDFKTHGETLEWLRNQMSAIKENLLKHGAILFRGFSVKEAEDFDKFVKAFNYESLPYVGGAAPRTLVTGNVFTSNESPPDSLIPFHHEMAQVPTYPSVLFFYCDTEPGKDGQTPLVPSNMVYRRMVEECPDFVNELEQKGVVYSRVLSDGDDPTSPIGRGWQSTYGTTDRTSAEKSARELVASVEWLPDGCMRTKTEILPAIREDTRTGKKTWFNSIIAVYRGWKDSRNSPETSITFGDGSPMPPAVMDKLEQILNDLAVDFSWTKGDVVVVDNRQVLHGRRTFTPPRRILASLCK
ncbi:hypothetical protein FSP39_014065 [Pinctada imbricata]|uniref:TauD/TfdA-like domain-containing protein n=1 Tax=Pinctada imbricata TaxID=66713 RepID=A0AA88XDA6_PINIB|nr:hypothetical protein FSP39_014065 [Pinctada imbricata]